MRYATLLAYGTRSMEEVAVMIVRPGVVRLIALCALLTQLVLLPSAGFGMAHAVGSGPPTPTSAATSIPSPVVSGRAPVSPTITLSPTTPTASITAAVTPVVTPPLTTSATGPVSPTATTAAPVEATATGATVLPSPTLPASATATVSPTASPPVTGTETLSTTTVALLNSSPGVTTTTAAYGRLPLSFEPNQGQSDAAVQFLSHGPGFTLYLTGTDATLVLVKTHAPRRRRLGAHGHSHDPLGTEALTQTTPISTAVLRLRYAGANADPHIEGQDPLPGVANYVIGNDPHTWKTGIPTFAKVVYKDVYPGIDLTYYGHVGQLEYDWIVQPGADPSVIGLHVEGARGATLDAAGNLVLQTMAGAVVQRAPVAYQEVGGTRQPVSTHYVLTGAATTISLAVGAYDTGKPLLIDPVLNYSSYLGGSGDDIPGGIAVDSAGDAYITGDTTSTDFPTTAGVSQTVSGGSDDAFVSELNASGTALVYSTYLGGNGSDSGNALAVDSGGNAYLTGVTQSSNFPTTANALQPTDPTNGCGGFGTSPCIDAFVAALNSSGGLLYGTYLGGSGTANTWGYAIALDAANNAYITGQTDAANFPTTAGAFQGTYGGGSSDVFVTKLNVTASGTALVYSTYLGGSFDDQGNAIAVDGAGNAYIAGTTGSGDFPTKNALQTANGAGYGYDAAFVTALNAGGSALLYSTYLGGHINDYAYGLAVDTTGAVYVTGQTNSPDFPVKNAIQRSPGGGPCGGSGSSTCADAFVAKINPAASGAASLVYSTYLGGTNNDYGFGIAVDSAGNTTVTGYTGSTNFITTTDALQGTLDGPSDAFVTQLTRRADCSTARTWGVAAKTTPRLSLSIPSGTPT